MNWDVNSLSSERSGLAERSNSEKQKEASKLDGAFPETFLQLANGLATMAFPPIDPRVTQEFDSSTAEKVARAVGQTAMHSFEGEKIGVQIEDDDDDDDNDDFLLDNLDDQIRSIGSPLGDSTDDQVISISSVLDKLRKGELISIVIESDGKVESRQLSIEDFNFEKFAIFNQDSNTVVHAGYDEQELELIKQDPILKGCEFIGLSPENLVAFRPFLLQIINVNKASILEVSQDKKEGSHTSESFNGRYVRGEDVKRETKSDSRSAADGAKIVSGDRSDVNQLKKGIIQTEKEHIEQIHTEEAKEKQKENLAQDRKKMIERKERKRELDKEQINEDEYKPRISGGG